MGTKIITESGYFENAGYNNDEDDTLEVIDLSLADDEGICADCGRVFTQSPKTFGIYLCEECNHIGDDCEIIEFDVDL